MPKVFDSRKSDFAAERAELMELLSPEEYEAAKTNTLNAHYTDFSLVKGIWQGMRELGFDGGNVLEPGCGSGNFIGAAQQNAAARAERLHAAAAATDLATAHRTQRQAEARQAARKALQALPSPSDIQAAYTPPAPTQPRPRRGLGR